MWARVRLGGNPADGPWGGWTFRELRTVTAWGAPTCYSSRQPAPRAHRYRREGMMNLRYFGTVLALACLAGVAHAASTTTNHNAVADQCEDACVHQCSANGGAKCGQTCVA